MSYSKGDSNHTITESSLNDGKNPRDSRRESCGKLSNVSRIAKLTRFLMELQEKIKRQRVQHIVSSYHLDGGTESFQSALETLLATYPMPLVELALVETLVAHWLKMPLLRGQEFLAEVSNLLKEWEQRILFNETGEEQAIACSVTSAQFYQITGLDPTPIFGVSARSSVHASKPIA